METAFPDLALDGTLFHDVLDSKHFVLLRLAGNLNFANAPSTEQKVKEMLEAATREAPDLKVKKCR